MAITSLSFLFLCSGALLLFHCSKKGWLRITTLGAVSCVFLLSQGISWQPGRWRLMSGTEFSQTLIAQLAGFTLLAAFSLWGFLALRLAGRSRPMFLGTVILTLILFFVFRHYDAIGILPLPFGAPQITVGLAYILFRVLQLVIDCRNMPAMVLPSFGRYLYHLFAFYTFLAGPIIKYQEHEKQLLAVRDGDMDYADGYKQYSRVLSGLLKIAILGDMATGGSTHLLHGYVLTSMHPDFFWSASLAIALGMCVFFLGVYVNFSGYMDIVCGIAGLFLLKIPENFQEPLSAHNAFDFWKRWHITLSTWFREYLFIPVLVAIERRRILGAKRLACVGALYFLTFFLLGMWHGPNLTFILVGISLGATITANYLWQEFLTRRLTKKGYGTLQKSPVYQMAAGATTLACMAFSLSFWWIPEEHWHMFYGLGQTLILLGSVAILWILSLGMTILAPGLIDLGNKVDGYMANMADSRFFLSAAFLIAKIIIVFFLYSTQSDLPKVFYQEF